MSYHCGHTPNVGAGAPFAAEYDFWGAILPGLDVVCKVVSDPTRVSEIGNLDGDGFECSLGCGLEVGL
jgi:hypothetical protein